MKYFSKIILIIFLFSVPIFAQEAPPAQKYIVYIATSGYGKRYHLEDCRMLRNSEKKGVPIAEAIRRGYTPCGVCKPGE